MDFIDGLIFNEAGLIPVVTQDINTREVLMLAYMNAESLKLTLETGKVHYYSRSRQSIWLKGETSGHFQYMKDILYDCDCDALLILAEQTGVACHTGNKSCFYRSFKDGGQSVVSADSLEYGSALGILYDTIAHRKDNPEEGSYTSYLFNKGIDKMLKKIGEENAEVIIAAKNGSKDELVYEISDLMYHLSVVMANAGVNWNDIYGELEERRGKQSKIPKS